MRLKKRFKISILAILTSLPVAFSDGQNNMSDAPEYHATEYFVEKNGLLVIEAENYMKKFDRHPSNGSQRVEHSWTLMTDENGYSGQGYMSNLPDEQCESCSEHNSPKDGSGAEMVYHADFSTSGIYHIWIRGFSLGGESNGVHVQLDNKFVANSAGTNMSGFRPHKEWIWENRHKDYAEEPVVFISAGKHSIHVYSRDDGFSLDKMVFGLTLTTAPKGKGPAESPIDSF